MARCRVLGGFGSYIHKKFVTTNPTPYTYFILFYILIIISVYKSVYM